MTKPDWMHDIDLDDDEDEFDLDGLDGMLFITPGLGMTVLGLAAIGLWAVVYHGIRWIARRA